MSMLLRGSPCRHRRSSATRCPRPTCRCRPRPARVEGGMPHPACSPAGHHPLPDCGIGHPAGPPTDRRPGRRRTRVHPPDPGPGLQVRRRVRRGLYRLRDRGGNDRAASAADERDRRAVRPHGTGRVHRPDADHWRAALAAGPRGVRRSLRYAPAAPAAPGTAAEPACRASVSACSRHQRPGSPARPARRPDPRIFPGRIG
jgi:hypothetical protein